MSVSCDEDELPGEVQDSGLLLIIFFLFIVFCTWL